MRANIVICILLIYTTKMFYAQKQDTIPKKHSPKLAAKLSIILPGLGQVYNKKYWKIPIIYAGIGTLGYLSYRQNIHYNNFKNAYKELSTTNPNGYYYMYNTTFTLSGLDAGKNYYRRNRDFYIILTAGVYVLNILDAAVDAHLFDFDVSDNIAIQINPSYIYLPYANSPNASVKICLNLKK